MTQIITPDTLPDYHFLFIAPNVEASWLFQAGRAYVERFQPTVISNGDLLAMLPESATVAVSLLTRRDAFQSLAVEIAQARDDVYLDALVYETENEAALALNRRANENQPFGVPLTPTPTPAPRFPLERTPGAVVNEDGEPNTNPSGFITMTPSPTPNDANNATPAPSDDNSGQVSPTPGSITGG